MKKSSVSRLATASSAVLEPMEKRMMMSTTIAAWTFSNYSISTTPNLTPAPSSGSGTAVSVGFQTGATSTQNSLANYPYPNAAATGSPSGDISDMVESLASGTDNAENVSPASSTTAAAWRLRGDQTSGDGWSDNAAIASQGAQFNVSTAGYTGISVEFDFDPSSKSAASELLVQYNPNVTNSAGWTNSSEVLSIGTTSNGSTAGITVATNSTNANIASGSYFQVANNAQGLLWENNLQASFGSIATVNNDANFGVRFVNAATGNAEFEVTGTGGTLTAFPAAGAGNWRFNDVRIIAANQLTPAAPVVTGPSATAAHVGTPVTLTSSAFAYPALNTSGGAIQWIYSTDGGNTFNPAPGTNNTANYTYTPGSIPSPAWQFEVQYGNSVGVTTSSAATVTVTYGPPVVVTSPANTSAGATSTVSLTASATSGTGETVEWFVSTNAGVSFSPIAGTAANIASGATSTYTIASASGSNDQSEYLAQFTNLGGVTNSSVGTLTVTNYAPVITLQPVSQIVNGGQSVTFTAADLTNPVAGTTVQWQTSTGVNAAYTNIASGANTSSYTISNVTDSLAGTLYRAVFTDSAGSTPTLPATLSVSGAPIQQWVFTSTVPETIETGQTSDSTLTTSSRGSADAPLPTLNTASSTDIAQTLGLFNTYEGVQVYSGADILPEQSTVNPSFDPYSWRVRSSHLPTGWSQLAPAGVISNPVSTPVGQVQTDPQGVQFDVNTTGHQNITLQFYWDGGGIADMQAQYSPDGGNTWLNVGVGGQTANPSAGIPNLILQNFSKDYPGITSTTTPPPYIVDMSHISAVNNNPLFQIRLVAAYDPNLPLVTDGNAYEPLTTHGQYADSGAGAVNALQVLDLGGSPNSRANYQEVTGGTFQLSFGGVATPLITYNPASFNDSAFVTTVQNDLNALSTIGGVGGSVTVADQMITPFTLDSSSDAFLGITFGGTLGHQAVPNIVVTQDNLTGADGSTPTAVVTTWTNGAAAAGVDANGNETGVKPYVDGSGGWVLSDFLFNGTNFNSSAPQVITNPANTTVIGGTSATFTATEYSELPGVSAQWQMSSGSSWSNVPANGNNFTAATNSSTYTFVTAQNNSNTGEQFRVVFTNSNGSSASFAATLTTVAPQAPSVTLQPVPVSVQVDTSAQLTATATGSPAPTVFWQVSSGANTTNFVNITDGLYDAGSQTTVLNFTPQTAGAYTYRAVFVNVVSTVPSNSVTVNVLSTESTITDWDFNQTYPNVTSAKTPDPYNNSPAPYVGTGTATAIGFNIAYNPNDPATGSSLPGQATGSFNADDIVQSPGAANTAYTQNTWRIRGGSNSTTGGAPANGYSIYAPQYTQGAQFMVSTVGYSSVYITMDWYCTTSGVLNARQQYTLDGVNWYNLDDQQLDTVADPVHPLDAYSNDFYGATSTYDGSTITSVSLTNNVATITANNNYTPGETVNIAGVSNATFDGVYTITSATGSSFTYALTASNVAATAQTGTAGASLGGQPVPLVFDLTGIAGVADNPNFGIRLVTAYAPELPLYQQVGESAPEGQYAVASSAANPTPYQGAAGNWRFNQIVFHGVAATPAWVSPSSISSGAAVWNSGTHTLTVSGPTTIIGDPGTDEPKIVANGSSAVVTIATGSPTTVNIGGLTLANGSSVVMTATNQPHVLVVAPNATFSISSTSSLDLGVNEIDFQATSPLSTAFVNSIVNDIATGYNGGAWGVAGGITSSAAQADATHLTTIGYLLNAGGLYGSAGALGSFDGSNPGTNDLLLRYTYYGDTNLDGTLDGSDYSNIDSSFSTGGAAPTWQNGDFNYATVINGSDYTLLDNAFNRQNGTALAQIASPSAVPTAQIAAQVAAQIAPQASTLSPGILTAKATVKTVAKTSVFATATKNTTTAAKSGSYAPSVPAATPSFEDVLKHDKKNTLAGSLLDATLLNGIFN